MSPEQFERVQAMALSGSDTWDLSPKDTEALCAIAREVWRLRAELAKREAVVREVIAAFDDVELNFDTDEDDLDFDRPLGWSELEEAVDKLRALDALEGGG